MLAVYGALQNPQPKAICIECIDLRFAQGFEHFREEMLEVNRHEDIVMRLAGSLTPLAYPNEMPSRCKYLKKQLVFKCKKFPSIERIIVIAHKNCAYYDTVPSVQNHRCNDEYGIERGDLPLIGSFLEIVFALFKGIGQNGTLFIYACQPLFSSNNQQLSSRLCLHHLYSF